MKITLNRNRITIHYCILDPINKTTLHEEMISVFQMGIIIRTIIIDICSNIFEVSLVRILLAINSHANFDYMNKI